MRKLSRWCLGLCVALVPCFGASASQPADAKEPRIDRYGDLLPEGAIARLGTNRLVQASVYHLAFAPNGKALATMGPGRGAGFVCIWDVATGKRLHRWETARVLAYSPANAPLTFSPDSRFVALAGPEKVLHVWDTATGKEVLTATHDFMMAVVFAPDGKSLATLARSGVRVYQLSSGKVVHELSGAAHPSQLAYSADGKSVIAVGHDQPDRKAFRVDRWDAATGTLQGTITFEAFSNFVARLSPDGQMLIVPGQRKQIGEPVGLRRWDTITGKELPPVEGKTDYPGQTAFAADGKTFTVMSKEGRVRAWQTGTGKLVHEFDGQIGELERVALSADGKVLAATGRKDQAIHLWNIATGKELHDFAGHRNGPLAVVFAADGKSVFTASRESSFSHPARTGALWSLRQWDYRDGKQLRVKTLTPPTEIRVVAFAPDGSQAATADNVPGILRLYRTDTGDLAQSWQLPAQTITMRSGGDVKQFDSLATEVLGFAPDGKSIAGASKEKLTLWETATGKVQRELTLPPGPVHFCFFPDGQSALISQWRTPNFDRVNYSLTHVDLATGTTLRSFAGVNDWAHGMDISPSTHTAAVMFRTRLHVYEMISGSERWSAEVSPWSAAAAFARNGQWLATAGRDGVVHLWDAITGRPLHELKGHDDEVSSLAWSRDGRWLVSAAGNDALIWDARALLQEKTAADAKPLTELELLKHWQALASPGGADCARALAALVRSPKVAVPFLSMELAKAPPGASADKVARWVADLASDTPAERETASTELAKLGNVVRPALEKALTQSPPAEAKRRIEALLGKMQGPSPAWLQMCRALEALELIGDAAARDSLGRFAKESVDSDIQRHATRAVHRLKIRPAP